MFNLLLLEELVDAESEVDISSISAEDSLQLN